MSATGAASEREAGSRSTGSTPGAKVGPGPKTAGSGGPEEDRHPPGAVLASAVARYPDRAAVDRIRSARAYDVPGSPHPAITTYHCWLRPEIGCNRCGPPVASWREYLPQGGVHPLTVVD